MVSLFFSYSHRDEVIRDELEIHLAMLKRQGVIETWHDRRIVAGDEFNGKISEYLEMADIVLLLVSPYFIASQYCYAVEMARAMERHDAGDARVIPVIVDPCEWHMAPFGKLLAMPQDGKPISKFPNMHDAFLQITSAIRKAAASLNTIPNDTRKAVPRTQEAALVAEKPRSSNLRLKRDFSQRDKDRFREETFQYMAAYFEGSLSELQARNPGIETAFRRVDANTFTATIYEHGSPKSECSISLSDSFGGDQIAYSADKASRGNSCNELLGVIADGTALGWKPTMGFHFHDASSEQLTEAGASEYFWSRLIEPLQS
ncbi:Toll-Interleukin receptor domain protein [Rhodopirellula maiorica SM1]|uniref:Toll-Interleukin receptor domain protein n=1 Tax=Rhodopirellula maiorica SM1 TaxID=1265738 RepID=M5RHT5_9BACT|nr:toll/interleukin-1 receptor domain-containing protein [Rhodopirellula maiorica]EMI18858.1 Toll-Interleukin receptor domain protein [Rhodopirellula maiorica SM1]